MFDKKDLEENLRNAIILYGFEFGHDVTSYCWQRNKNDVINRIEIGYRKYPGAFYLRFPVAVIKFNEVEHILEEFIKKYRIENFYGENTIYSSFGNLHEVDYTKFDIEIHDEESFSEVNTEVNKIIKKGCVPFFEQFKTLEDVWFETEKMPIDKMANFIVQPLPQRRIVIKRLCNDENYQEYVNMVIDFYKSDNDPTWLEIGKLDNFLKSMV